MKRILLLTLGFAPLFLMAQHKISGYAMVYRNASETPAIRHKLYLIPADSIDLSFRESDARFKGKYLKPVTYGNISGWIPKSDSSKADVEKKYKVVHDKAFHEYLRSSHRAIQSKLVDINGNYEFDDVPDGNYIILIELKNSLDGFDITKVSVNGKDVQENFTAYN